MCESELRMPGFEDLPILQLGQKRKFRGSKWQPSQRVIETLVSSVYAGG
jgi:hypothetical protein